MIDKVLWACFCRERKKAGRWLKQSGMSRRLSTDYKSVIRGALPLIGPIHIWRHKSAHNEKVPWCESQCVCKRGLWEGEEGEEFGSWNSSETWQGGGTSREKEGKSERHPSGKKGLSGTRATELTGRLGGNCISQFHINASNSSPSGSAPKSMSCRNGCKSMSSGLL